MLLVSPRIKQKQLKEDGAADGGPNILGVPSRRNGEISCIERVPARDGWPAAGIKMLLMHLDGSLLSVLFWGGGRLFTWWMDSLGG